MSQLAPFVTHISLRTDYTTNWDKANPILRLGEIGIEILAVPVEPPNQLGSNVKKKIKIGDGIHHWADLQYFGSSEVIIEDVAPGDSSEGGIGTLWIDTSREAVFTCIKNYTIDGNIKYLWKPLISSKVNDDFYWNSCGEYIPYPGEIIIYKFTDPVTLNISYKTKIGDGNGNLRSLPFLTFNTDLINLNNHILNTEIHTTQKDKDYWNSIVTILPTTETINFNLYQGNEV